MRKLASIQIVKDVIAHPNADLLDIAKINGWQCVIKKNELQKGDLGVYFEIDSFLPADDERYEFLNKNFIHFEGNYGARIRTIKLRKELSQGLILPLSLFPEITNLEEGTDVTELLHILKYEKPIPINSKAKGNFPSFIEKTDQERVQNLHYVDREAEWEMTEKIDGSSLTIFLNEGIYGVCSRNLEIEETDDNPMWNVAKKLDTQTKLETYQKNIALQGEIIGPKIQGNRYERPDYEFYIFDVYDIDKKRKMLPEERRQTINDLNAIGENKLYEVPNFGFVKLPQSDDWIEALLQKADGQSHLNQKTIREGFVFKHKTKNESFKVISNKYLLKIDE